ncbi:MAG: Ni/Fe hydrogenase subunit alpha [Nanoarchaeota archaeon]|nr:Ni/Fe hydrogenase subunit alpha [Nanoarchaeota archaeon]
MGKTITLNHITKMEGHAKLNIRVEKGKVKKAELTIFEGSRYFEGILQCQKYNELAPIASRICGVCSVVHFLTATKAVEDAFNVKVSEQTQLLRELIHIGGHIQSHVLHLYFLALPDYVGYPNAIQMASKYKNEIQCALRIKRLGNRIVNVIGGRDVHPLTIVPGGMSRLPDQAELKSLSAELKKARKDFIDTVTLFAKIKYPRFEKCIDYYSLTNKHYNILNGKVIGMKCNEICTIPLEDYEKHMKEYFQEHSTAEFVVMEGRTYMVGALPRLNHNYKLVDKKILKMLPFTFPSDKPFHNIPAQAVEMLILADRAINILENIKIKKEKPKPIKVRAGSGVGVSEAPRGLLFHKYTFDKDGVCQYANITTPTSQNLRCIQEAIKEFLPNILDLPKEKIKLEVEQLIRAYDPCISCSTHFLELNWEEIK